MSRSRLTVAALLLASAVNLGLMVPGGFVETRDFSAYAALVLGAFNLFLTVLGLGSLILAYRVFRGGKGYGAALAAGGAFVGVYLLDLGRIFPVTPDPMSGLLAALEWLGTGLGAVLAVAAWRLFRRGGGARVGAADAAIPRPVLVGFGLCALAILLFATRAAMTP